MATSTDIVNRKVGIDLNIRAAYLKVDEPTEVYIVWKRGTARRIDI